jgi:hypothetical protein
MTAVPGWTPGLWAGEAVTLGAERVQGGASMSTLIVALVLLTDSVVKVIPETGSVKLWPTSRNASSARGEVPGVRSRRVLLSG